MSSFMEDRAQVNTVMAEYRAKEIKRLITQMLEDIDHLNDIVTLNFQNLSFEWADEFQRQWKAVYSKGVPTVIENMSQSVKNVENAIEHLENYSKHVD